MADTSTTILLTAAAGAAGAAIKSWIDSRLKRAEKLAEARAAASAADATGRHEVAKAEIGLVPAILDRMAKIEADCDRDVAALRAENDALEHRVVALTAQLARLTAECELATRRAEIAEQVIKGLREELDSLRRDVLGTHHR